MVKLDLQVTQALPNTPSNHNRLLPTYEKLVELTCMPSLDTTLEYSGNPTNAECLKYLELLKDFQPDNLVAVCALHGIDSDPCKDAYQKQYISSSDPEEESIDVVDLSAKLNAIENEKPLTQIKSDLRDAEKAFAKSAEAEIRKKIISLLDQALSLACSNTRIVVQHTKPPDKLMIVQTYRENTETSDPLTKLVHEFSGSASRQSNTPTASPTPIIEVPAPFQVNPPKHDSPPKRPKREVWRLRHLSAECASFVDRALAFNPHHARALCYQQGFSSPDCIAAKRVEREIARQEALQELQKQQDAAPSQKESRIGTF